jgi:hypothetical protein
MGHDSSERTKTYAGQASDSVPVAGIRGADLRQCPGRGHTVAVPNDQVGSD